MNKRVFWITGLSGAGKTTIGTALYYRLKVNHPNVVLLDGDALRDALDGDYIGYTTADRHSRALRYARICKLLADQNLIVICCTIAMFSDVRDWNRENIDGYVEVFLDVPKEVLVERDSKKLYSKFNSGKETNLVGFDLESDLPKNPDILIKNDGSKTVFQCVNEILAFSISNVSQNLRDEQYWNEYYSQRLAQTVPSQFAEYVLSNIKDGDSLADLGCGNGRDSLYFHRNNIKVTAIDRSSVAISQIKSIEPLKLHCICGDISKVDKLCKEPLDHCYSRFSLHALSPKQQHKTLTGAYNSLKPGGKLWIEVRGIYDTLYGKGEQVGANEFVHGGHYRRFVVLSELSEELKSIGFEILYSEENTGFAPYGDDDPMVIRIAASK